MDKVERNVHSGVESSSEREMAAYRESGMELEGDGFETISHNKHIISRKEPSKSPRCQPHKHPFTANIIRRHPGMSIYVPAEHRTLMIEVRPHVLTLNYDGVTSLSSCLLTHPAVCMMWSVSSLM